MVTRPTEKTRVDDGEPGSVHLLVVAFIGPLMLAYAAFRFWLRGDRMPWWFALAAILGSTWYAWAALYRRRWVEVSSAGLSFQDGKQSVRLSWPQVDCFEVGNPADPVHAYVKLTSGEVIRLPQFFTVKPAALVEILSERQQHLR